VRGGGFPSAACDRRSCTVSELFFTSR
jgi:hypothetical protein